MSKPPFNPNQPYTPVETIKPKFNPNIEYSPLEDNEVEEVGTNVKDFGIGGVQGLTLGFGDEILGALQAGSEALTDDKDQSMSDLYKLYRKYQQINQQGVKEAEERSPYLTTAGNIAGGILPAAFTSGGTVAPSLARVAATGAIGGAITGAGSSQANIEDLDQLAKDTAIGGAIGGIAAPAITKGMDLTKKALSSGVKTLRGLSDEFVPLQKVVRTFDKGNVGESVYGLKGEKLTEDNAMKAATNFGAELVRGAKQTSEEFANAIKMYKNVAEPFKADLDTMQYLSDNLADLTKPLGPSIRKEIKPTLDKMAAGAPVDLEEMYNLSKALRDKVAPAFSGTNSENNVILKQIREYVDNAAENMLPKEAMQKLKTRYNLARQPSEVLLNKGELNQKLQPTSFSDMLPSEAQKDLQDITRDKLLNKLSETSSQGADIRKVMRNFIERAEEVRAQAPDLAPNLEKFLPEIQEAAKDVGILRDMTGVSLFGNKDLTSSILGKGYYGAAYGAGQGTRIVSDVSKYVFNLPKQGLEQLANTVGSVGGETGKAMSRSLQKALAENNRPQINATLFSIVQNPELRQAIEIPGVEK